VFGGQKTGVWNFQTICFFVRFGQGPPSCSGRGLTRPTGGDPAGAALDRRVQRGILPGGFLRSVDQDLKKIYSGRGFFSRLQKNWTFPKSGGDFHSVAGIVLFAPAMFHFGSKDLLLSHFWRNIRHHPFRFSPKNPSWVVFGKIFPAGGELFLEWTAPWAFFLCAAIAAVAKNLDRAPSNLKSMRLDS